MGGVIPAEAVWIDLLEPSIEEERFIEKQMSLNIPTREEMDKIEVLTPFYEEGEAHYMTITVLDKAVNEHPDSTAITFILSQSCLITIRYTRPKSFSSVASRMMRFPLLCTSPEIVLANIIDALVNKIADVLEEAGNELDALLKSIFEKTHNHQIISTKHYNKIIRKIGYMGNLISKNRESLVSINRMLIYFSQIDETRYVGKREHRVRFKHIIRELHSLGEYATFLSQRNSFLLDATLGMISVEQNMIIKVFTVAAAVFMPPTLIASIYGMNFKYMPELQLWFAYPLAIILIIASALLPYTIFKKKGWL
ncbi:magnesium transporter CorA family protein [Candidatus Lariskella endosymbiont of Hedychridium roseum]|uniref:magnesium transporter CorA family protein n=1 Tax=Candidatus Lariskella endosymbiont of Hedychridium roseum TaxID=3077949 RepID=UPI0030D26D45